MSDGAGCPGNGDAGAGPAGSDAGEGRDPGPGRSSCGSGRPAPGGADPGADGAPELALRGLTKRFGETVAVDGLELDLVDGEFLTLLGPSGCGKTTVLRLVAGFESPDAGAVRFRGRDVTGWSPRRRGFGMVFQNYALFPHMDVFENVAFGLRSRGRPDGEVERRVGRVLELVDLPGFGERRVQDLSGGQQQRVALARALAIEPELLLLDEPLSNLDAALRERTRVELRRLVKELGVATLFVTHDQEEAFDLSDRVAVMEAGRLRQVGTPEELYGEPADPFVAGFVGSASRFPVRVEARADGEVAVLADGTEWRLPAGVRRGPGVDPSDAVLWLRPEDLELVAGGAAGGDDAEARAAGGGGPVAGRSVGAGPGGGVEPARADSAGSGAGRARSSLLAGTVRGRRFRGAVTAYRVETEAAGVVEALAGPDAAAPGDPVGLRPRPGARAHLFAPQTRDRAGPAPDGADAVDDPRAGAAPDAADLVDGGRG